MQGNVEPEEEKGALRLESRPRLLQAVKQEFRVAQDTGLCPFSDVKLSVDDTADPLCSCSGFASRHT